MSTSTPTRRTRSGWKILAAVLIGAGLLIATLPWFIARGPLRRRVVAGLDRAMAPGQIRFDDLHLSWFGPTQLDGVTILDPQGKAVIKASSVRFDHSLGQLLVKSRSPGVLTLEGSSVEVERSEKGTINLVEALKTLLASPDPERDLTIRVVAGSIRYRDPLLAEPAVADTLDLTVRAPYAPAPVTWSAKLSRGDSTLESHGDFDAWLSRGGPPRTPELQVEVVGKRWPFVVRTAGVDASGRFEGALDLARKRGHWVFSGDARLDGLRAGGKSFAGDTLALDKVEAGWDVSEGEEGWKIRRLSITSPLAQLKADGQLNGSDGSGKQKIEGQLDLATIAHQLPHALRLRDGLTVDRGSARVLVDLDSSLGKTTCEIEARVSDLAARDHDRRLDLKDPAIITARIVRSGLETNVESLAVHTPFLDASAKGSLAGGTATGIPSEGLSYRASIDFDGLRKQVGEWFDLGKIQVAGRAEVTGTYSFEAPRKNRDSLPGRYANLTRATLQNLRVEGGAPGRSTGT